jgi:hypothetical protein
VIGVWKHHGMEYEPPSLAFFSIAIPCREDAGTFPHNPTEALGGPCNAFFGDPSDYVLL